MGILLLQGLSQKHEIVDCSLHWLLQKVSLDFDPEFERTSYSEKASFLFGEVSG